MDNMLDPQKNEYLPLKGENQLIIKKPVERIKIDEGDALKEKGNECFKQSKFVEALELYNQAIQKNPADLIYYSNKAACFIEMNQFDNAYKICEIALKISEQYAITDSVKLGKLYYRLGSICEKREDLQQAIQWYQRSSDDKNRSALQAAITKLALIKKQQEDKMVSKDFQLAEEANDRGRVYFKQEDFTNAIREYTEAIRIIPTSAKYYFNRGVCKFKQKSYELSIKDFEQCVLCDNNYLKAYFYQGDSYFLTEKYQKAEEIFRQALKLDPNNQQCLQGLKKTLIHFQNSGEKAEKQIKSKNNLEIETLKAYLQDIKKGQDSQESDLEKTHRRNQIYNQKENQSQTIKIQSSLEFFKQDILLLEELYKGGQGDVRLGFNQKSKEMVVIKKFNNKEDYVVEKDAYKYLDQKGLGYLTMKLIESDDENNILIIQRGICDLGDFIEIRRKSGDPLDINEIFMVMLYVVESMNKLNSIGVSLCDTKEANILIKFSKEAIGYVPVLSDLGAIYCKKLQKDGEYPTAYTPLYLDPKMEEKIISGEEFTQLEQIKSEIFTLGRMIQKIIINCIRNDTLRTDALVLFKEHSNTINLLQLLSISEEIRQYSDIFNQFLDKILLKRYYTTYQDLINDINFANEQYIKKQYQQQNKKTQILNILRDDKDQVKEWFKMKIEEKGNFDTMTISQLKKLSFVYSLYQLLNNQLAVSRVLIQKLDLKLKKIERKKKNNQQSKKFLNKKIDLFKDIALAQLGMAEALERTGQLQEAIKHLLKCQDILSVQLQQKDNPLVAIIATNISELYRKLGHTDEAKNHLIRAQIKQTSQSDQARYQIVATHITNGLLYRGQGNLEKALEIYNLALSLQKQYSIQNQDQTATINNNIGEIYYQQGLLNKALEYYNSALLIKKQIHGENHYELAGLYCNIGVAYQNLGKLEKALEFQKMGLVLLKSHFGENHFQLGLSYTNLGEIYRQQNNFSQALEYYNKAIVINKKHYGENDLYLADIYNNIGITYDSQQNLEKAHEFHNISIQILRKHYGDDHFLLAKGYSNIGNTYRAQGQFDKAFYFMNKALVIQKAHYKEADSCYLGNTYFNISLLKYEQQNKKEALQDMTNAYNIFQKTYGKNHEATIQSFNFCQIFKQSLNQIQEK